MKKIAALILAALMCCMSMVGAMSDEEETNSTNVTEVMTEEGERTERKGLNIGGFSISLDQNRHLTLTYCPEGGQPMGITLGRSEEGIETEIRAGLMGAEISTRQGEDNTTAVSVNLFRQPPVTAVVLSRTGIMMLGRPVQITAVCEPEGSVQDVTWISSNPNVAEVDETGLVTAKDYGTCTVTAVSANGVSAECSVIVNKSNTITRHFTWGEEWPFLIQDTYTMEVDGLTGEIVSYEGRQYSQDTGFLRLISNDGIRVTNVQKDYVEFESTYSVKVGVNGEKLNVNVSLMSSTCSFRMDNQGNLKKISGSNADLMTFCR